MQVKIQHSEAMVVPNREQHENEYPQGSHDLPSVQVAGSARLTNTEATIK
jgi:hypothetical protein